MKFATRSAGLMSVLVGLTLVSAPLFQGCANSASNQNSSASIVQTVNAEKVRKEAKEKYKQEDYQGSLEAWTQYIKLNPNDASAYYNRGRTYARLKNPAAAIQDFNQTIKLDPTYARAYNKRGELRTQAGDKKAALADFQQAAALYQKQGKQKDADKIADAIQELQ